MQKSNSRIISPNLYKQPSQTFIQSRINTILQQNSQYQYKTHLNSLTTPKDPQSIMQLFKNKDSNNLLKVSSQNYFKNKKHLLVDMEERIFSEVIQLLDEIDLLRQNVITVRENIKELQIEFPDIDQQVRFHGYSQKLTEQQCIDLEEENSQLIKHIQDIESSHVNTLEEVLKIEKQKYEDLKEELSQGGTPKNLQQKIKNLRIQIGQLQGSRYSKVRAQYPQFDQIKLQNEQLRKKTIASLKNHNEQKQLKEYLENEDQNRLQFMEELKIFKSQFNRIKYQNLALREKLQKKYKMDSKENSNVQYRNKVDLNKSLKIQSYVNKRKGNDKLSQYQSYIRMMQNLKN